MRDARITTLVSLGDRALAEQRAGGGRGEHDGGDDDEWRLPAIKLHVRDGSKTFIHQQL
jgi:hypothetical protein